MIMQPVTRQSTNEVRMDADVRALSFAPRCCAIRTLTALPMPIRKPVNSVTRMVVEPTAPKASALEYLPTIATSAILKSTCKSCDSMSGALKINMFFHSEPSVIRTSPCVFLTLRDFAILMTPKKTYMSYIYRLSSNRLYLVSPVSSYDISFVSTN